MTSADSRVRGAECRGPGRNPAEGAEAARGKPNRKPEEGFEPFVTKLRVAERMEVEIRTVTRLMRRGVLRYYKVGPMVRFKWSEVESDLRDHFHVCFDPRRPSPQTQYPRRAE
jgi:excisionase family DNA binding protein